jgi:hypothetical protein
MNEVARGEQLSQDGMNSLGFGCVFHFMATQFSLRILSPDLPVWGGSVCINYSDSLSASYYYWIAYF